MAPVSRQPLSCLHRHHVSEGLMTTLSLLGTHGLQRCLARSRCCLKPQEARDEVECPQNVKPSAACQSSTGEVKAQEQEFLGILGYTVSTRLAWAI